MPKHNIVQLAVEQEATPGTAIAIAAADVLTRIRSGYTFSPDVEMIELEEVSDVGTTVAAVAGRKQITFSVSYNLRGPGDTSTDPTIVDLWEAAVLTGAEAFESTVGVISGGPFVSGETVTGTGGGTGMVLQDTSTGDTTLPHLVLSGTLDDADTLTGSTSGATATQSGAAAGVGYCFRPADWETGAAHHCTVEGIRGGTTSTTSYVIAGRGCLADINWAFSNGGPCVVSQNFVGAISNTANKETYTVTSYPEESTTVPRFLNAALSINSVQPTGINEVVIDYPTNPALVTDANSALADGVLYADYNRALPTITLTFDQVQTGTYDYFADFEAGTTRSFQMTHGSASGALWTFSAPNVQFRSIEVTEREPNRAAWAVTLGCTGTKNEELLIWQH